jgi:hypothetical protein
MSEFPRGVKSLRPDAQRTKELYAAFRASFQVVEAKGIIKPLNLRDVYASGLDIPISAPFVEAVPIRDGVLPGEPMTRRNINDQLKR